MAETQERLGRLVDLLTRWNKSLNLIAPREVPVIWERHIRDSLQLAPMIPTGVRRAIDLGSGGGFPGLVLAIATGIDFDLIESDRRKTSFLRTAILETAAPAAVHDCRIEDAPIAPAALVTARALAPLPRLLPLAAPLLVPGGLCLLLKGAKVETEVADAEKDWEMTVRKTPSETSADGTVLSITGLRRR
jgi:16S rRNA (guanine527-N7)-methyltransferase